VVNVLFVCLGNICRSPMAEGVFGALVAKHGMEASIGADSAGTSGFHSGELPDPRMMNTAEQHAIMLTHRARKLVNEDFERFDYILSMDSANLDIILAMQKRAASLGGKNMAKVLMMRSFDPEADDDMDVPDPYYGGMDGFEEVYHMLERSNEKFLDFLKQQYLQHEKSKN
jgi:protein-tyrosine phosphatase